MFQVKSAILGFFNLILWIFSKFILDALYKSLGIPGIFAEENLKYFLKNNNI